MSDFAKVQRPAFIIKSLTRCTNICAALLLLSVYLGSLSIPGAAAARSGDEVFCPLQKTWVKKYRTVAPSDKQKEPLKDVCAREDKKSGFLFELSESLRFTRARPDSDETETLFFNYFAAGKPALAQFISSQNSPQPQYITSAKNEKSVNNSRLEFTAGTYQNIAKALPRSVVAIAENNFISRRVAQLKNISRHISPRAPPVHL